MQRHLLFLSYPGMGYLLECSDLGAQNKFLDTHVLHMHKVLCFWEVFHFKVVPTRKGRTLQQEGEHQERGKQDVLVECVVMPTCNAMLIAELQHVQQPRAVSLVCKAWICCCFSYREGILQFVLGCPGSNNGKIPICVGQTMVTPARPCTVLY